MSIPTTLELTRSDLIRSAKAVPIQDLEMKHFSVEAQHKTRDFEVVIFVQPGARRTFKHRHVPWNNRTVYETSQL